LRVRSTARVGSTISETLDKSQALVEVGVNDIDVPLTAHVYRDADDFFAEAESALKEAGWATS
jgi:hypothetical protein